MYLKIQKEILEMTQGRADGRLKITAFPEVGQFLKEHQERLEKIINRPVEILIDATLPWEDYRILID
jgi:tryptophanyl-tRNA synthetase